MNRLGIEYETINCQEDTEPRDEFGQMTPTDYVITNFVREMPVVSVNYFNGDELIKDKSWWFSGARPDRIDQIAKEMTLLTEQE